MIVFVDFKSFTALLWDFHVSFVPFAPTGHPHNFILAHSELFSCRFTLDRHQWQRQISFYALVASS